MEKTSKKILIVEDSKSYLLILEQNLIQAGFDVTTAENGEEGLVAAEKTKPDLILLDIEMPKMDGITMSKKLRESNNLVPIIFLTNMSDLSHISVAAETAAEYIIKSDQSVGEIVTRVKERLDVK